MTRISPFRYFKTSPEIIRLVVMMYVRFPLSLRNVEDLLHERGINVSHETVRFWWNRFGPMFAAEIRRKRVEMMRAGPQWRWHVDEVFVKINGERHYLWRAVDHEGEVLEAFVSKKRDRKAALKFLRKSMRRYGRPEAIVTDRLRSYGAALRDLRGSDLQVTGRWLNNRAENSHQPFRRRERAMLRFRRMRSLQKFASVHSSVHNLFNLERHLYSRDNFKLHRTAALAEWRQLGVRSEESAHRSTLASGRPSSPLVAPNFRTSHVGYLKTFGPARSRVWNAAGKQTFGPERRQCPGALNGSLQHMR
jgi:putative transposase